MELPDHEIEQTFKVNILSHYWVSINIKEICVSQIFDKNCYIIFDLYILFKICFTDYKVILERYDKK